MSVRQSSRGKVICRIFFTKSSAVVMRAKPPQVELRNALWSYANIFVRRRGRRSTYHQGHRLYAEASGILSASLTQDLLLSKNSECAKVKLYHESFGVFCHVALHLLQNFVIVTVLQQCGQPEEEDKAITVCCKPCIFQKVMLHLTCHQRKPSSLLPPLLSPQDPRNSVVPSTVKMNARGRYVNMLKWIFHLTCRLNAPLIFLTLPFSTQCCA